MKNYNIIVPLFFCIFFLTINGAASGEQEEEFDYIVYVTHKGFVVGSVNKIFGCLDPSSLSTYIGSFLGAPQDDDRKRVYPFLF